MSSLINDTEIAIYTGVLGEHYNTFAQSTVTIFKEPIKTVNYNSPVLQGYGREGIEGNYSLTPVSGVFRCLATWPKDSAQPYQQIPEAKIMIPAGTVRIKVERDCKNFIDNGDSLSFIVDGINFVQVQDRAVANFLGLRYYIYYLLQGD